jgi:hypothetical protein
MTTNEQKRKAWQEVGYLAERALVLLTDVNEGVVDQVNLMWLVEKAHIQQKLWETPKNTA